MCLHLALAHLREFTFDLINKESVLSSFDLGMETVTCLNESTFGLSKELVATLNKSTFDLGRGSSFSSQSI